MVSIIVALDHAFSTLLKKRKTGTHFQQDNKILCDERDETIFAKELWQSLKFHIYTWKWRRKKTCWKYIREMQIEKA